MRRPLFFLFLLLLPAATLAAASNSGLSGAAGAIRLIYGQLAGLLPALSMLLVVLGALTYAAGKALPNPEFAGRASGLAAAMIAASAVCFVIILVLPAILSALYPCPGADPACWDMSNVIF
ncbi:Uncharacterised protein [uncultured archaeon]|nr:Uncharacterised protein [uncultured archaeon]